MLTPPSSGGGFDGALEIGALLAGVVLLGVLALTWVLAVVSPPRSTATGFPPEVPRHERRVLAWAVVIPLVVAALALPLYPFLWSVLALADDSQGAALLASTPYAVGALALLVLVVGERTWPSQTGAVRRASLAPRPGSGPTAGWLGGVVIGWFVLHGALLVTTALTGKGDSLTHVYQDEELGRLVRETSRPYPGWSFGVGVLVAAAMLVALAFAAVSAVRRRPAAAGVTDADDELLRRLSVRRVLGIAQVAGGLSLAVDALVVALVVRDVGLGALGAVLLAAAGAVALVSLALAVAAVVRRS